MEERGIAAGMKGRDCGSDCKEKGRVKEYRGVTLMASLYKVYTMVLTERLREEIEKK